jgi:hypothetical protein
MAKKMKSQATMLVEMGSAAGLWHTPDGDAYATLNVAEHLENWPLRSRGFRRWLARRFYESQEAAPNSQAITDALATLEGKALHNGRQEAVAVRVAEHEGSYYLDLCDLKWRAVEITPAGWQVIDNPPVKFRRAKGMLPLPTPTKGGNVNDLQRFVNVQGDNYLLLKAWLLAAMRPTGPYPVLCLHGEQGSAKSTAARMARALIDPSSTALRCQPRSARDLMIAANNGWIINLDNLSEIKDWLSDALCRLSTGGGFATRELFTDGEEILFDAMRPICVNGIEELGTRGDLLDRSLLLELPIIPETRRRKEADLQREFIEAQPGMLGALLTATSKAMENLPSVVMNTLPRMADFAFWVTSGEAAMGIRPGEFMAAYLANRAGGNELAIEHSPVGKLIVEFMTDQSFWEGTATKLLKELNGTADERTQRLDSWPKTAATLGGLLRRLAPNLRALGVDVETGRSRRARRIVMRFSLSGDADVTDGDGPTVAETPKSVAGDGRDGNLQPLSEEVAVWTG